MMGIKTVPQPQSGKKVSGKKVKKGKTPKIGIKNLGKLKQHSSIKPSQSRRFQTSMVATSFKLETKDLHEAADGKE